MIKFDELVAAGVAENTDRETCFFRGATYAEDLALQTVRQSGVYHHREQKINLELAMAMQHRTWMQGLWDAANPFELPAKFSPIYLLS